MNEEISIERIERTQTVWRIHSYYDTESIAVTREGMRQLLDWLLLHAKEFDTDAKGDEQEEEYFPVSFLTNNQ